MSVTTDLEPGRLRAALGHFATGVTVVTAAAGDTRHGTTANALSARGVRYGGVQG